MAKIKVGKKIDILWDDCSGTFTFWMRSFFVSIFTDQDVPRACNKGLCTRTHLLMTWLCCLLCQFTVAFSWFFVYENQKWLWNWKSLPRMIKIFYSSGFVRITHEFNETFQIYSTNLNFFNFFCLDTQHKIQILNRLYSE